MSRISGVILLYGILWWIGMEYASFPVIAIISEMTLGALVMALISALIKLEVLAISTTVAPASKVGTR